MANHAFNIEIIFVGGGVGSRQHVFGVKDIKTFILHCAHIKEIDGDDHIDIKIVLQAKALLVPLHRVL